MSTDDESLLGAYLDGELELEERLAFESTLSTNSQLAGEAHALADVRELVGGLSRPLAPDMEPEVMRRVREASLRRRPWRLSPRSQYWAAAGLAALALADLALRPLPQPIHRAPVALPDRARAESPLALENRGAAAAENRSDVLPANVFDLADAGWLIADGDASGSAPARKNDQQRRVRGLVDNTRMRRVFLVADRSGQPAEQTVASLVERTARQDYFKITIPQGIVISPRHRGKATVFAFTINQNELEPLRDHLRQAFSDRVEEEDASAAVAVQLADIGQVVAVPASPIADLRIPQSILAMRSRREVGPTAEQERSSPAPPLTGADSAASVVGPPSTTGQAGERAASDIAQAPAAASAERRLLVLVWIADTSSG
jgi:anti-sigma factor RsiW